MDASSEPEYRKQHQRWLSSYGFTTDPFALYEAETEQSRDLLPRFFIDRPYVDTLFDDPATPRPGFLFARRGAGKTATLKMVARRCYPGKPGQRALPVPYDDFTALLRDAGDAPEAVTAEAHVRAIIRALTKVLAETVPATYWEAIAEQDRPLLMRYVQDFGYPMARARLAALIQSEPLALDWAGLTPKEMLGELARIVTQLQPPLSNPPEVREAYRFRAIYVLVDRADESPAGPGAALSLLLPLVRDQRLLNTPNVAFKFFLPAEIGEELKGHTDLRLDRYPNEPITWDETALRQMVDRRVEFYSERKTKNFGELCHSSATNLTMKRLTEAAQGSPRTLIRLCSEVIRQTSARNSPLIYPQDVNRAISEFHYRLEIEQTPGMLATPALTPVEHAVLPAASGEPALPERDGVVVDVEAGQVYVDRKALDPPLTAQEFDLLRVLYVSSPNIVEHETLIKEIWPVDADTPGDPQNLRKLISRLRQRLEPETRSGGWKYIRNSPGRGYYLVTT